MTESEIAEFEERLEKAIDDDNDYLIIIICERLFQHSRKTRYEVQYARALKIHRRFDESQKLFKKLLKNCPDNIWSWLNSNLADIQMEKGNYKEAMKMWIESSRQQPEEATFLIFAASAAYNFGKIITAEKLARQATKCSKGAVDEAWLNLGGYLSVQYDYEEALKCYEKALEIDPEYERAKERRQALLEVLKFEKEFKHLEE